MENEACSEVWFLLNEAEDENPSVDKTDVSGLIVAKTLLYPYQAIGKLRDLLMRSLKNSGTYPLQVCFVPNIYIKLSTKTKTKDILIFRRLFIKRD